MRTHKDLQDDPSRTPWAPRSWHWWDRVVVGYQDKDQMEKGQLEKDLIWVLDRAGMVWT